MSKNFFSVFVSALFISLSILISGVFEGLVIVLKNAMNSLFCVVVAVYYIKGNTDFRFWIAITLYFIRKPGPC